MIAIDDIARFLEKFAPAAIAEEWDNVGLLVGDRRGEASRIMTCLTVTSDSANEAIRERADLIVSHHPFPFRPVKQITSDTHQGLLLWRLIGAGVAIYSPHTAFDSAVAGINAQLAALLGLSNVQPLVPQSSGPGAGRFGDLPEAARISDLGAKVKSRFNGFLQLVGDPSRMVRRIGVACGSGGEFVPAAHQVGCDLLLTGEARFHACLEAESLGIALLLAGHYTTERFAVEELARILTAQFPNLEVWASRDEHDPIKLL